MPVLTQKDLTLADEDLARMLVRKYGQAIDDENAPKPLRDLSALFELNGEVRNGGFAQYFFNDSCPHAFDAWFAAKPIAPVAHGLLGSALWRLGIEHNVDLDLAGILKRGAANPRAALAPSHEALLAIHKKFHTRGSPLVRRFKRFRELLGPAKNGAEGFDVLEQRFFEETNVPLAIAAFVKAHPSDYMPG